MERFFRTISTEGTTMITGESMTASALRGITVRPPVLASTKVYVRLPGGDLAPVENAMVDVQKTDGEKLDATIRIILELEPRQ